jgi:serine/threonine protein kinase
LEEIKNRNYGYEILKEIGSGNYGTVFKARVIEEGFDTLKKGDLFAVKQIPCCNAMKNNMEIKTLKGLGNKCPYLVQYYGSIFVKGSVLLV